MSPRAGAAGKAIAPMLCSVARSAPEGEGWTFEPKYDGIRVIAYATPDEVLLVTRNGNDKSRQFPDLVVALRALSRKRERPLVLDGEIVAVEDGAIERFGKLQSRMHVKDAGRIRAHAGRESAAFVAFDLLLDGGESLVDREWGERRERLEEALGDVPGTGALRLADTDSDGEALIGRAQEAGWEGVIAKRVDSPYHPGRRSSHWLKLKLENTQEFVVGGWTEPRRSREHIGALLLGYYDPDGKLEYAGHTGTGFDRASLAAMGRRLARLERKTSPFREEPKTNERAHWVTPKVVVQVRFNEWTQNGTLRQPVFVGVREDKDPREVVREAPGVEGGGAKPAAAPRSRTVRERSGGTDKAEETLSAGGSTRGKRAAGSRGGPEGAGGDGAGGKVSPVGKSATGRVRRGRAPGRPDGTVIRRLAELREAGRDGEVPIRGEGSIPVTNLDKVFFPRTGETKGDLLAFYTTMAPHILPWMRDRPLVLKRFPNGVRGKAFYQQSAPGEVPEGVRVEQLVTEEGEEQARFVGGNLATLLYTVQLGAISYDPWHSRIQALDGADYTVIDLDPGPGATFRTVVEVARRVEEEMDRLGLHGALKTSGSSGVHIYLPLPEGTPLEAATLVAQIVATRVASRHPEIATVERMTRRRPRGTIYVDFLQNILGKTIAGVYAVRAREEGTVSTPLAWEELTDDLDPRDFTMRSVPERVATVGELWAEGMAVPNSLERLTGG
jgi:bifunctional non-homologous end joining protein LigD